MEEAQVTNKVKKKKSKKNVKFEDTTDMEIRRWVNLSTSLISDGRDRHCLLSHTIHHPQAKASSPQLLDLLVLLRGQEAVLEEESEDLFCGHCRGLLVDIQPSVAGQLPSCRLHLLRVQDWDIARLGRCGQQGWGEVDG